MSSGLTYASIPYVLRTVDLGISITVSRLLRNSGICQRMICIISQACLVSARWCAPTQRHDASLRKDRASVAEERSLREPQSPACSCQHSERSGLFLYLFKLVMFLVPIKRTAIFFLDNASIVWRPSGSSRTERILSLTEPRPGVDEPS